MSQSMPTGCGRPSLFKRGPKTGRGLCCAQCPPPPPQVMPPANGPEMQSTLLDLDPGMCLVVRRRDGARGCGWVSWKFSVGVQTTPPAPHSRADDPLSAAVSISRHTMKKLCECGLYVADPEKARREHLHVANPLGMKYFCTLTISENFFECWLGSGLEHRGKSQGAILCEGRKVTWAKKKSPQIFGSTHRLEN